MSGDGQAKNMSTMTEIEKSWSEYKYVVVHADKLINTPDVIKTTGTHAAIYSVLYAIFLFCKPSVLTLASIILAFGLVIDTFIGSLNQKVFAGKPLSESEEKRFSEICSNFSGCTSCLTSTFTCLQKQRADTPVKFLTYALPMLAATAYLGRKCSIISLVWIALIIKCTLRIPEVQQKVNMVKDKASGLLQKKQK
ncbi:unnamed protein product [Oikopleura dioica]|uniref:Reticulon domain-containing protein n=1 Tax=Oikopleura dioica TaxID=34765 RepID=E4X2P4_OIKDI|nr:unnamed protein product [Oikopleura dioica]